MRGRRRVAAAVVAALLAPLVHTIATASGTDLDRPQPIADLDGVALDRLAPDLRSTPVTGVARVSAAAAGDQPIAPPPTTFEAPAEPATAPPAALRAPDPFAGVVPEDGTWSVIIGINDYPGRSDDLTSASADARDVNEALARYGVAGKRRLLITDREATADVIRLAAQWLVAHSGPDATAVFFFAGHVRKLGHGTEAMVGADGGLITDRELADLLAPLRARHTWVAMAACYGGGFTEVLAPDRVLTAAAGANSLAYENSKFGRSYLVEYMVRRAMIEGRAGGSVEEAFAWARDAIARDYPQRVPVQYDQAPGEVRFTLPAEPSAGSAPPPAEPSTRTSNGTGSGSSGGSSGGTGGGGSGGGSGGGGSKDSCASVSLGVVRCGG